MGRKNRNAENIIVGLGRYRGCEFTEKFGLFSLFAEQLTHTGSVPSHWQLDDTSGINFIH